MIVASSVLNHSWLWTVSSWVHKVEGFRQSVQTSTLLRYIFSVAFCNFLVRLSSRRASLLSRAFLSFRPLLLSPSPYSTSFAYAISSFVSLYTLEGAGVVYFSSSSSSLNKSFIETSSDSVSLSIFFFDFLLTTLVLLLEGDLVLVSLELGCSDTFDFALTFIVFYLEGATAAWPNKSSGYGSRISSC